MIVQHRLRLEAQRLEHPDDGSLVSDHLDNDLL
jgi:hypothetical protein